MAPNPSEALAQRSRQLADLGSERRFEITTAEDRDYDPFIKYNERDLEAFRDSVQNEVTTQLRKENQTHLAKWSSFHETVDDAEKDLPDLMNGQSHRARLHFEMRNKGTQITTAVQKVAPPKMAPPRMAPPQIPRASSIRAFAQRVSVGRFSPPVHHGPSASRQKTKSLLDPAADHSQSPSRPTSGIRIRGRATKIQRRPVRPGSHEYVGGLVDPSAWLEDARRKLSRQSDKSAQLEKKAVQPVRPVQPVQPTRPEEHIQPVRSVQPSQPERPAQTVEPVQHVRPVQAEEASQPVRPVQPQQPTQPASTVQSVQPSRTEEPTQANQPSKPSKPTQSTPSKPAINFERQVLRSNLPQPQTSNSRSQSQVRSQDGPEEDLLLAFDASPEKIQLGAPKTDTMSDAMDLDEASVVEDTITSTVQDNIFGWLQELGVINDTLADFDFTNVNQKKVLTERKDQLLAMLNAAVTRKNDNSRAIKQQPTKEQQMKTEPVESPLQKSVKAKPFAPLPKSVGLGASVRRPMGMETSKYAPSRITENETNGKSNGATDDSVDYWQKTLPKRALSKQSENEPTAPLAAAKQEKKVDDSHPSKAKSKSLYESRYAC